MEQYIYDDNGETIGVFLPIDYWNELLRKYPECNFSINNTLPEWQKNIIDERLAAIEANPGRLRPISEFYEELDED